MRKTLFPTAILLVALLTLPLLAVRAGWFDDEPVTIHVPALRVGDKLLYEHRSRASETDPTLVTTSTEVFLVQGVGRASDRFGIERDVDTFRWEERSQDVVTNDGVCHRLQGGHELVRYRPLLNATLEESRGSYEDPYGVQGDREWAQNTTITALFQHGCGSAPILTGRTLREGDRLLRSEVETIHEMEFLIADLLGRDPRSVDPLSEPAVATSVHGRDALRFTYPSGDGTARREVVVAGGLPGVLSKAYVREGVTGGVVELAGIERGDGAPLAPSRGAKLPEENPEATFRAPGPRDLDDVGFGLPYPYADAYADALRDPDFARWMQDHPDAVLGRATYRRAEESWPAPGVAGDGTWSLGFEDEDARYDITLSRHGRLQTPAGAIPLPAGMPTSSASGGASAQAQSFAQAPERVADSASIARLVEREGIALGDVVQIEYVADIYPQHLIVSTMPPHANWEGEGKRLLIDPVKGGLSGASQTTMEVERTPGLLAPAAGSTAADAPGAMAALAPPGLGSGLAVAGAAATGLALLVLFVKLVALPLFTRLRKDRLLDNPVRARLYERVRAEPGIHLAGLEEFTGLGRGATRHHVDQLVKHHFLVETRDEGFTRYFAAGEVPPDAARRAALLRAGSMREVYDLLQREPHLSLREAGKRLGLSAPSVHRAKKRLESAGLLPAAPEARVERVL